MTFPELPGTDPGRSPGLAADRVPGLRQAPGDGCRFALSADPTAPGLARERVRAWLAETDWPPRDRDDIELAMSEAVTNAAEHAYPPGHGGHIVVDAHIEALPERARRVRVIVRDQGRWRPALPTPGRGYGLKLMTELMDAIVVRPDAVGGGTEIELTSYHVPASPPRT
jgi:anti-sigma regulatory factor (Ser/Thr protein kinase)